MKRSVLCSLVLAMFLGVVACGDDDGDVDAAPINLFDAAVPDAAEPPDATPPIDAQLFDLQAAVGIDEMRIVGGDTFAPLGGLANGQIESMIDSGQLLLALEWRGLDDPSGQNDDAVDIGFYQCEDPDFDPDNNFDATNPDRWVASAASLDVDGNPLVVFPDGTLVDGVLDASSTDAITLPGLPIPIEISNPRLTGVLTPAGDGTSVHFLEDGVDGEGTDVPAMISGAMTAATLGASPNITMGLCPGDNLLDILTFGCSGFIGANQPDTDIDGDGLEKLCDECGEDLCKPMGGGPPTPDAMPGDGVVSCCLDGDGTTVIEGSSCWADPRIADGYTLELAIHGTRIILMSGVDPN